MLITLRFKTFTIIEPSQVVSFTFNNPPSCYNVCDGSVTVVAGGGDENFTYTWSPNANGQTTANITNICDGKYYVTITDGKCLYCY